MVGNSLFKFEVEQRILDVAGVKVGGQPGELPTVLIGSIFYSGQEIVSDENKGFFNKEKAEALIGKLEKLSNLTSNPFMLDVYGSTEEAFIKYLDFVADTTKVPILLNAFSPELRISAAKHADEIGLAKRVIYNSIQKDAKSEELEEIRNLGIKAAVILAYDPCDDALNETASGRLDILKEVLLLSEKAGIENVFFDTAMPAFGIGIGAATRAVYLVKEQYGDEGVVGIHTSNSAGTCNWVKDNFSEETRKACDASQNAIMPILGADWIMFGPLESADQIFPAVAAIDTYIVTATAELGINPAEEGNHPIFKLMG
jgi:tetrahydromethanopterin S-methyltransferase subunit H